MPAYIGIRSVKWIPLERIGKGWGEGRKRRLDDRGKLILRGPEWFLANRNRGRDDLGHEKDGADRRAYLLKKKKKNKKDKMLKQVPTTEAQFFAISAIAPPDAVVFLSTENGFVDRKILLGLFFTVRFRAPFETFKRRVVYCFRTFPSKWIAWSLRFYIHYKCMFYDVRPTWFSIFIVCRR